MVTLVVHPATAARFDDVALMIGPKRPDANVCWCLSHRLPAAENRLLSGPARRERAEQLTRERPATGVLAYDGDEVVGWTGIAPRASLPVARSTRIAAVDDQPVWSIFCLRVRPGHRGKGVSHVLLRGALDHARRHGAPGVEAYPVDNRGAKVDQTMAFVGLKAVFEAAGFTQVATTDAVAGGFPRVVVRLMF